MKTREYGDKRDKTKTKTSGVQEQDKTRKITTKQKKNGQYLFSIQVFF